jgi:hypothetical protein
MAAAYGGAGVLAGYATARGSGERDDQRGVCVDRRTPEQRQADKHEAADGKNGRCAYSYDTQSYCYPQRGFLCIHEITYAERRTAGEKEKDKAIEASEEALRQEHQRQHKTEGHDYGRDDWGLVCGCGCGWDPVHCLGTMQEKEKGG